MPCGSNELTFEFRPGVDATFAAMGLSRVMVVVSVAAVVVVPVLVPGVVVDAVVVVVAVGAGDFFAWP